MASLLYRTGMRLMECVRLRVQDVDFACRQIGVRNAKGAKDRMVPLPEALHAALREHLGKVRAIFEETGAWVSRMSISPTRSRRNIRTPPRIGSGSTCFRAHGCPCIRAVARRGGITYTRTGSRRP
jgi:integrase